MESPLSPEKSGRPGKPLRAIVTSLILLAATDAVRAESEPSTRPASIESATTVEANEQLPHPNSATALIERLRAEGNEAAVAAYEAGVQELIDKASTEPKEYFALFLINQDGSFEWKERTFREAHNSKISDMAGIIYVPDDMATYYEAVKAGSEYISIHTHPSEAFKTIGGNDMKAIPPSPTDIKGVITELSYLDERSFTNAHFQVVTESGTWDYGFNDSQSYQRFIEAREAANDVFALLNLPENQSLMEETLTALQVVKKRLPREVRPVCENIEQLLESDVVGILKSNPDIVSMLPSFIAYLFETTNTRMPTETAKLIALLEHAHSELLIAYKEIDTTTDGNFIHPPFDKNISSYVARWNGMGIFMQATSHD